jgi:hypothetical protein
VARLILFPPAYLNKNTVPNAGFAHGWGITAVTRALIAYVVKHVCIFLASSISPQSMLTLFQVRFALSEDERYTFENFNYNVFYDNILEHLYNPKLASSTDAILKWWNEYEQFHDCRFLC